MRAWTIQPEVVWQSLETHGTWTPDWSHVDSDYAEAYRWMARQLTFRSGPAPSPQHAPVWFWSQWSGGIHRPMPDLRSSGHLAAGTKGVRLELEVDEECVLLSDFNLWHYVLNYWYLPASVMEGDAFDAELAAMGLNYYSTKPLPNIATHALIEKSWQRVFDLDWDNPDFTSPRSEKMIQGVMWEIKLDQVRRVKPFVAR